MLKDKPNIRSDFHESYSSTGFITHEERLFRWLKIFFIFGLGFVLGMVYAKSVGHFQNETLAMSTSTAPLPQVGEKALPLNKHASSKA